MKISVTELQDFMRCPRAWTLQSANRRSLVPIAPPRVELHLGSAVHEGIAANAMGFDANAAIESWGLAEREKLLKRYREIVGKNPNYEEWAYLDKSMQDAQKLMDVYFRRYTAENPLSSHGLTYICPEVSFSIPLTGELEGHELVGTIDGLAVDDSTGEIVIVENKTYSQRPNLADLMTDHQEMGYCFAATQLLGIPIRRVLYNGINKKIPKPAKVLVPNSKTPPEGWLSMEWNETLLAQDYIDQVYEHHQLSLAEPGVESVRLIEDAWTALQIKEHYHEFILRLRARENEDQTPFHTRYMIPFTTYQIEQWGRDMLEVIKLMVNDPYPYPHFRWEGCWDCNVKDLCGAIQRGEDVEDIISHNYTIGTYGTQEAQRELKPTLVHSIDELKGMVETWKQEYATKRFGSSITARE